MVKTTSELKDAAREQLKGKWTPAVLVCFISWLITQALENQDRVRSSYEQIINGGNLFGFNTSNIHTNISTIPMLANLVNLLIGGAITFGVASFFIKLVRNENPQIENILDGFKYFATTFLANLLIGIFTVLWFLLLIIPGIIAILRYSMTYYILNDNPEMSALDAISQSKEMMKGHKGDLFVLWLSFIGWWIVGLITLGIGFLWITPYYNAAKVNFYEELRLEYNNFSEPQNNY